MKQILVIAFVFYTICGFSQDEIVWNKEYKIKLSDFQSNATNIGDVSIYRLQSGIGINFSYQMNSAEFMFKKNFNTYAKCAFNPKSASLVAPDSLIANSLINYAQFEFDLTEFYTRKFRKRLYEEKSTFSNADFFQPTYDEILAELNERNTLAGNKTDVGRNREELEILHKEVLLELEQLSDYCYTCKPPKMKKNDN